MQIAQREQRIDALRRVSPMPIRMPVVNGTRASPASRIVSSRAAGTLSGEPKCGPPRSHSRSDALSSMMPCETDTLRSAAMSSPRHHAGIDVRQQAGLVEAPRARLRAR